MTTKIENDKIISTHLIEAKKQSEYAKIIRVYCSNTKQCPLYKREKCVDLTLLGVCPYAKRKTQRSLSTKRGKSYREFIEKYKKEKETNPEQFPKSISGYYDRCLQFIGDYVYLPYPHMNHLDNKKAPFLSHSSIFTHGSDFMERKFFTPEIIIAICHFRPFALMGGEIKGYQEKTIPIFLFHLKYICPELYKEVLKLDPSIKEKEINLIEDKPLEATIINIPSGITKGYVISPNMTVLRWDGEEVTMKGTMKDISRFSSFRDFVAKKDTTITVTFIPDTEETKVVIQDTELKLQVAINNPELIGKQK